MSILRTGRWSGAAARAGVPAARAAGVEGLGVVISAAGAAALSLAINAAGVAGLTIAISAAAIATCVPNAQAAQRPATVHVAPAGMVLIPGGVFEPLYKNEGSKTVAPFFLDETPVTNAEYLEFVRARPEWRRSDAVALFRDDRYLEHWKGDLELGDADRMLPGGPVTNVSWFAARAYARWKGKRLPTQAEWEIAAEASETASRAKDDPAHTQRILQWYARPTQFPLPPASSMPRDVHGVRGLHGLVWEWVEDFNTAMITGESRADAGLERNLFCGSGALGAADVRDYAAFMRYAFRSSLEAKYAVPNLGFRCARDAMGEKK